jgi:hypothetical protein
VTTKRKIVLVVLLIVVILVGLDIYLQSAFPGYHSKMRTAGVSEANSIESRTAGRKRILSPYAGSRRNKSGHDDLKMHHDSQARGRQVTALFAQSKSEDR